MHFEEFAVARLPALLRYATLLCGDREEGRDLVQDVLAKALVRWRRITTMDEPYAYVRRMVTNQFLSARRRRRLLTVPLRLEHERDEPGWDTIRHDDELWQLLGTLPAQQRAVLVLRYYEGLTDDEIAEALNCRPGTVRGYASRALAALRIEMEPMTREGSLR